MTPGPQQFVWLRESKATGEEGVLIHATVLPNSSRTEIVGEYAKRLKIRIQQPALDGKANKALCRFLAEEFDLPRSAVSVVSGETAKLKTLLLSGAKLDTIYQKCAAIKRVAP